jgi:hypothetical protein
MPALCRASTGRRRNVSVHRNPDFFRSLLDKMALPICALSFHDA